MANCKAEAEKSAASKRTETYYAQYGEANMTKHYHHFSVEDLGENAHIVYTPKTRIIRKLIGGSPFAIIEVSSSH